MSTTEPTFLIANLNRVNRELRRMGKEWDQELRDASGEIAERLVGRVRSSLASSPYAQDSRLAPYLKARRGNRPKVAFGAARKVASGGARASDLVYGVEFGAGSWRFPKPHRGREGYYLYPQVRRDGPEITRLYFEAVEAVWDRAAKAVRT